MPFIEVRTAQKLTSSEKNAIKSEIGASITLIPTKSEDKLMMAISDGEDLYFRGDERASAAFVDVRLKDEAAFEDKANFTAKVFDILEQEANIAKDDVYVNIMEFDVWGSRGELKK